MLDYLINAFGYIFMNFILGKTQDGPTHLFQIMVFSLIFFYYILQAMPIRSICFYSKFLLGKSKVNYPLRDRIFRNIINSTFVKFVCKHPLNLCWRVEPNIFVCISNNTTSRTKFPFPLLGPRGINFIFFATFNTFTFYFLTFRWLRSLSNHTFLATVSASVVIVATFEQMDRFTAVQAISIYIFGSLENLKPFVEAFWGTKSATTRSGWWNGKGFTAFLANLCDRHNKIPPTRDVRLSMNYWGRPTVGSGLFGTVDQTVPIPIEIIA